MGGCDLIKKQTNANQRVGGGGGEFILKHHQRSCIPTYLPYVAVAMASCVKVAINIGNIHRLSMARPAKAGGWGAKKVLSKSAS